MNRFHNTVEEHGAELAQSEATAITQDEKVLTVFKKQPTKDFTPCEIHAELKTRAPLTSIRRSITNLQKAGLLKKLGKDRQRLGIYGKVNYCWQYQAPEGHQGTLALTILVSLDSMTALCQLCYDRFNWKDLRQFFTGQKAELVCEGCRAMCLEALKDEMEEA